MLKRVHMRRAFSMVMLIGLVITLCVPMVYANSGLNGVGSSETTVTTTTPVTNSAPVVESTSPTTNAGTVQQSTTTQPSTSTTNTVAESMPASSQSLEDIEGTANAIGGMFANAGPDEKDIEEANAFIQPFAEILNKIMAIILGLTSLLMMFITMLDLLYMAFPPVRDMLDGGRMGQANMMGGGRGARGMGGGMRGMGMGRGMGGMGGMGMNSMAGGMGMGGMGMAGGMGGPGMGMQGGMQQPQQMGGGLSAVGRWVSDEAIAACMESQGGMAPGMGVPLKSMVFSYMKKRAMFLILFGVCVVLFTSTVFTDMGIRLGTWLLRIIMGFGA